MGQQCNLLKVVMAKYIICYRTVAFAVHRLGEVIVFKCVQFLQSLCLMCVCPPDDGYVLLHVPAEYLGGGVRRGQARHSHRQ